jgi:Tol biopolymer transport system component
MSRRVLLAAGTLLSGYAALIVGITASTVGADPCPNAPLRTGPSANLPDCRAYELVSPSFKFGAIAGSRGFLDGSHIQLSSLGAFNGSEDNQGAEGATYLTTRGAAGWSSVPLNPPASEFQNKATLGGGSPLEDVSQDFSRALVVGIPSSSQPIDRRFYVRQPNGALGEVGPVAPPATVAAWAPSLGNTPVAHYQGGSPDLSHLAYELNAGQSETNFLWPGDTTIQGASLYEYVGTGNGAPTLVGVDNAGHLISQCGTDLGSIENGSGRDVYNAISADGNTIFFNAAPGGCVRNGTTGTGPQVRELYARIGRSMTVPISEPTLPPAARCTVGHVCFGAVHAAGVFQGASRDGSKALFLTEQPLLNGDEDASEDLYMAEIEGSGADAKVGRLVQVSHDENPGEAAEVQGVARVSMDGSRTYFVARGVLTKTPNALGRAAVAGAPNLYVYEPDTAHAGQSRIAFVAALSESDSEDWFVDDSRPVQTTPDGRFLLFASRNGLTPDCPPVACPGQQLYRYDAQTGDLVRVSVGDNGFNANGTKADFSLLSGPSYGSQALAGARADSMSDDGAYVFFTSPAALTPQAINDPTDTFLNVYEYHDGHVHLISDGHDRHLVMGGSAVTLIGANRSGSDVFFTTSDPLVPQDTDTQMDVYDARVGGGIPQSVGPAECQGDGCQGPLQATASAESPGSMTFSGPGNVTQSVPAVSTHGRSLAKALRACRRAPRRKRHRCEIIARRRFGSLSKVRRYPWGRH